MKIPGRGFVSLLTVRSFTNIGAAMFSKPKYEEAVQILNTFQSNKVAMDQMKNDNKLGKKHTHLEEMKKYMQRTEIDMRKLDDLGVIHISGTKGKGTTSAMCESILRRHGLKTGFYSSPHLVVVRERIRINGDMISEEKFTQYFYDIYTKLESTKKNEDDMPKYFHFLTLMAFHVFISEKVDVAILEVGIGGIDDSTNIVRNPYVVGITALGIDHVSVLGNTIEKIAHAKAGIMKSGADVYTVRQPVEAMAVLNSVAREKQCALHIVPDYESYKFTSGWIPKLSVNIDAYKMNASLAIQLSHGWLRRYSEAKESTKTINGKVSECEINGNVECSESIVHSIPKCTAEGLSSCHWPGRYQRLDLSFAELFLDGAHTKESMEICVQWFSEKTRDTRRVLMFSATGDRNSKVLLQTLSHLQFESVNFVVPVPRKQISKKCDTYSTQRSSDLISRCQMFSVEWCEMFGAVNNVFVYECIEDAIKQLKKLHLIDERRMSVLVTGSLYLVGGVLEILNPNYK